MAFLTPSNKGKVLGLAPGSRIRIRDEEDESKEAICAANDPDENKYQTKATRKLSTWLALAVLAWLLGLFLLVIAMDRRLPEPLTLDDLPNHPDSFIEERARRTLRALTSIGARPAGSYENEVGPR